MSHFEGFSVRVLRVSSVIQYLERTEFGSTVFKMNSTYPCPRITALTKMDVPSETQNTIPITFFGLLAPITVIANSLLAFALIKTKQLRKSILHICMFLLCISDILLGAVEIPFFIIIFAKYRHIQTCTLGLVGNFLGLFNQLSVNFIFIITLHRYINVNPELRENRGLKKWLTSRTGSIVLVLLAFLFAVSHGLLSSYLFGYYYNRIPNWILKGINCVLFIAIFVLYLNLFWKVKKHTQANNVLWNVENQTSRTPTGRTHNNLRSNYFEKLTETVFLILTAIHLCYLPIIIMDTFTAWVDENRTSSARNVRFLYFMSWGIAYINSTVNAVIITCRNDKLKAFFTKKLFR